MTIETEEITSEFLFIKYKGIPAPWEILAQAKRFGFKCKKYANWSDVHDTDTSRQLLIRLGDTLIDAAEFDITAYAEFSRIWERVQRWAKDKEGFSIEPDIFPEFEVFFRLVDVGSKKPDLVDVIIDEFGYDVTLLSLDERWIAFIAICIHKLFQSNKRYQYITEEELGIDLSTLKSEEFINSVYTKIVALYLQIGFDVSSNDEKEVISLFLKEVGCPEEPFSTERSTAGKLKDLPKVWVEKYEGGRSELVKFQYTDGNVIVKLNKTNVIFKSNSSVAKLLGEDEFWSLIGYSLHSHINQIDEIQDFFDAFARQLRLRG